MRSRTAPLLLLPLILAASALAQPLRPSPESVTVTGTRSRQVMQDFVKSFATPTRFTGKIARWNDGICPVVVGLPRGYTGFVGARLRDIAGQAGAPVAANPSCKPNIEIVFTTKPQALIDNVRRSNQGYLGYYDGKSQLDALATVTRPIQAWYTTATQDAHGKLEVDTGKIAGQGLVIRTCENKAECEIHLSSARAASVTGTRLGDGLRSGLYHVIIIADPNRLQAYEMGSLADYIAMLALTQVSSLDDCRQLPSIVNMLAKDCDGKSDALTENDIAYLHGLYRMDADLNLSVQRDQMAYGMEQELKSH